MYRKGIYASGLPNVINILSKINIDAIFTEPKKDYIKNIKNSNLLAYIHKWPFRVTQDEALCAVIDIFDQKRFWNGSGCPNSPILRDTSFKWIEESLSVLEVDGLVLDGIRYPSAGSGLREFLTCFCANCKSKAREFGYNLEKIRQELRRLFKDLGIFLSLRSPLDMVNVVREYTSVIDWINFRSLVISEYVKEAQKRVKNIDPKIEFGITVFSPSLSIFVGQDYPKLTNSIDFIQPMTYHRGNGIACINFEIAKFVEDVSRKGAQSDVLLDKIFWILGFSEYNVPHRVSQLYKEGLPLEVIEAELYKLQMLRNTATCKITPIFFIIDATSEEIAYMKKLEDSTNLDGIVYFAFYDNFEKLFSTDDKEESLK